MKITLEQHGDTMSVETEGDDLSTEDMVRYFYHILLGAAYSPECLNLAIVNFADEINAE